ncbi:MAG: aminotransferase class V-fold PLP-dependent enzyme [Bdellovibrionota bacterium]
MFDKSVERFPISSEYVFLGSSSVSPLSAAACEAELEFSRVHRDRGFTLFERYRNVMHSLRAAGAELLQVPSEDVAFVSNCAEGLSMIANGFPFEPGDEIVSYTAEYPSNHYPWVIQQARGVVLKLLPDRNLFGFPAEERPVGWSIEDLERTIGPRTKLVALSHVQFTSGFAADLDTLGAFCHERGIPLVIDAAQSLGAMPILPREWRISALVSSGWKWLLGPLGTGLFYTSPEFRARIGHTMAGPELMKQGDDYLNHTWNPLASAERFEYSTTPFALAYALEAAIRDNALRYGVQAIWQEISRLQKLVISALDTSRCTPLLFPEENRSGILSVITRRPATEVARELIKHKVVCTARGGYLRIAPHYYATDDDTLRAVQLLNSLL